MIRTRIAPSPTGLFHLGTARAALCNYLFSRKNNGRFVLRIEDTDVERSKLEFEKDILEGMKWLGIDWDEGPIENSKFKNQNAKSQLKIQNYKGEFGPYRQSERIELYEKYILQLLKNNKAYYCFCTEEELAKERELQMTMGQPPKYSGKCALIMPEEAQKRREKGEKSVIRFRVPADRKIKIKDLIRSELEFDSNLIGDSVIAKDEKTPLYNFAVVVDDYLMKISHVIRGEDHISNTPKQILIAEALGFPSPFFAHLPLILAKDRSKLSKRHGATSLSEYRKMGYLPEAMLNFMAFLGWTPKCGKEILSKEELIAEFDLADVGKAGAIFNMEKLDWINGQYIRAMDIDKLTELCVPYLIEAGYVEKIPNPKFQIPNKFQITNYRIKQTGQKIGIENLQKVIALEQERIKKLSEIVEVLDFYFKKDLVYDAELLIWKKADKKTIKNNLEILEKFLGEVGESNFEKMALETEIKKLITEKGIKTGEILWPMRVALSGKKGSPGPFELAEVLGKKRVLARTKYAIALLK